MGDSHWRDIISGKERGTRAAFDRAGLRAASWVYGLGVRTRLAMYTRGILRRHKASIPVICVGNLTVGGTGKTPMVELVVEVLRNQGHTPGILSRGYGAGPGRPNDEAAMLAVRLPGIQHVQNPDRVAGVAELAAAGVTACVMDDGFSHLRLRRDLDILLVDATCPDGYGALLPRGTLREPVSSVKRAGLAVITRSDAVAPDKLASIASMLRRYGYAGPDVLHASHAPHCIEFIPQGHPKGAEGALADWLQGKRIVALSGIGNPAAFASTLASCGADVVHHVELPDHFPYPEDWLANELPKVYAKANELGAEAIVTTQKDGVKLRQKMPWPPLSVGELHVTMKLSEGADTLRQLLLRAAPLPAAGSRPEPVAH